MSEGLAESIRELIKGKVDQEEPTLEKYSRDASLFSVKPSLVAYPEDASDVQKIVEYVAKNKTKHPELSVTARSAGTDMTGGPLTESIVLSLTEKMNHIDEIGSDYAWVEPGVFYRDFEIETLKRDLIFPSYPASKDLCAIGGIISNNSGGEKTLKYGKTEEYLYELEVILDDGSKATFKPLNEKQLKEKLLLQNREGEIYRHIHPLVMDNFDKLIKAKPPVSKNSAGYYLWNVWNPETKIFDLTRLIVGSQGTLALVSRAKIRLVKKFGQSRMLVIFLKDLDKLADIAKDLLPFKPDSLESYDDNTFHLAVRFMPEMLRKIKGSILKLTLALLPEAWMLLTGGFPKLVILAEFTAETAEEAHRQATVAQKALKSKYKFRSRVTVSEEETDQFWVVRRQSFSLLRSHVHGLRTAPFIDDFAILPEHYGEFLPKLYKIMSRYKLIYTIAGHIGDGNFHIIPLMDPTAPGYKKIITELYNEVNELVLSYDGTITAEHNDGMIRSPYLPRVYGKEIYQLFMETKKIFDPKNIFNPGKKVNANLEYAFKHLDLTRPS